MVTNTTAEITQYFFFKMYSQTSGDYSLKQIRNKNNLKTGRCFNGIYNTTYRAVYIYQALIHW